MEEKMIEIKIDDETYTERQYKRDLIRLLDSCKKEDDTTRGTTDCDSIICIDCPLHEKACMCNGPSSELKIPWLERVKTVYDWTQKHPVVTNLDKLKELFGLWIEPAIVIGSEDDDEDEDENENPLNFEFLFMKTGDYTILTRLEEKDDTFWNWLNEEYKEPDQK
jgi:hypothetical protein